MNWQFVDATERVAFRVNPDGSIESVLASALPPDVAPLPAPVPALADYQKAARARIDSDVDAVYYAVIGDRTTEYQATNDDAKAFKNAGYVGTAPASVQCWATVKGWTAQQAADDILATAANWLNAQQSMRASRLQKKQDVTAATTNAEVDTVLSAWSTYIAGMRSQLGV
jgi:hypothetical protein